MSTREPGFYWVQSATFSDGEPEVCLWDTGEWGVQRWHFTRHNMQVAESQTVDVLSERLKPPVRAQVGRKP